MAKTRKKPKTPDRAYPLPCPGCGSSELQCGIESADAMQVKCLACGLKMVERLPDEWPPGCRGKMAPDERIERWRDWTLQKLIRRWNKRYPRSKGSVLKVAKTLVDVAVSLNYEGDKVSPVIQALLKLAQKRLVNQAELLRLMAGKDENELSTGN